MAGDKFPNLSSRQLRAVLAVARYRSFIAAATSLGMSQPAITRIIKQVEAELGVSLFVRNTRHVTVTKSGEEFAALAERLLNDLKINVTHLRERTDQPCGQIVVASVFSLANAVIQPLIAGYSKRFGGIEIHLREGLNNAVKDAVRSGLADFGIGYTEDALGSFVTEDFGVETFHVVSLRNHILAERKRITLQALAGFAQVSFPADSGTRRIVDEAATAEGISLRYAMTSNRLPTLLGLVRNGVGLAVVPASERPSLDDPDLVSRPLTGHRLTCRIGAIRLRERELSPAALELLLVIRRWIRTHPASGARQRDPRRT